MLAAGSDAKTFSPSFCSYESERMSSSFKRLVGGAQLLRSLEWLIQPLVRVLSYPAPPLWLLECLQRCLGNGMQISEQISQPLPYLALRTAWRTDMQPDLCVIKSSGAQTVFFLELWWKRHFDSLFPLFQHRFSIFWYCKVLCIITIIRQSWYFAGSPFARQRVFAKS